MNYLCFDLFRFKKMVQLFGCYCKLIKFNLMKFDFICNIFLVFDSFIIHEFLKKIVKYLFA